MPAQKPLKKPLSKALPNPNKAISNNMLNASNEPAHMWLGGISLESPAPTPSEALATGERQVEFRVQQQVQPALQYDAYVQVLRLTIHIVWNSNLLLITEMDLCAEHHKLPDSIILTKTADNLYQIYRPTLEVLLAAAGHQPPLPEKISDVNIKSSE